MNDANRGTLHQPHYVSGLLYEALAMTSEQLR